MKHPFSLFVAIALAVIPACGGSQFTSVSDSDPLAMSFVEIPAGRFQMGSPDDDPIATPMHEVVISRPFELMTTEVTQGQWEEVMGTNPSTVEGVNLPVTNVSWEECREFCEKLTTAELESGELSPGTMYRLPTEAEWEYACRAGATTRYCFGDPTIESKPDSSAGHEEEAGATSDEAPSANMDSVGDAEVAEGTDVEDADVEVPPDPELDAKLNRFAWFEFNSEDQPNPVLEKEANAWGLHDMHGNVWEWCLDTYDPTFYAEDSAPDPHCTSGASQVIRGGSYASAAPRLRSDHRYDSAAHFRYDYVGFRVARVTTD